MQVLNKYTVLGGMILIIMVASTLYQSDYRSLLIDNPDAIAILIDYEQNNRLEIITRGYNWDSKREVLRWRYDEKYFTLYTNRYIAARSEWRVETAKGTLQRRSYTAGTPLYYEEVDDIFRVVRQSNYMRGHELTETHLFTRDLVIENFPQWYYVDFVPVDDKEYRLEWKISEIEILPGQKQGFVEECFIELGDNVKVDWCKERENVDYVWLSKQYNALYINFKPMSGIQNLDVSLVDPIEQEPGEDITYTNTTRTICNESGQCTLTLYSGITQVFEDQEWKPIDQANSLLGYYNVVYFGDDNVHLIELVDLNTKFVEFKFSYNDENLGEYEHEVEDGKMKTKFKIIETVCDENGECQDEETEIEIEIEEGEELSQKIYGNPLGKKFKIGEDSTTIILQDADTENLEDNWISSLGIDQPDERGADDITEVGGSDAARDISNYKWNITDIPTGSTINDANLSIYLETEFADAGESWNITSHHIFSHPTYNIGGEDWVEGNSGSFTIATDPEMSYDTSPYGNGIGGDYNTTAEDTNLFSDGMPTGSFYSWSVTNMLQKAINDGDTNISIGLFPTVASGSPSPSDIWVLTSKDEAGAPEQHPFLKITYTGPPPPEDSCSCPASGHWQITGGDVCTLTDECVLSGGNLHIVNGSLNITSTGVLMIPSGYGITVNSGGSFLTVEESGTVILNK